MKVLTTTASAQTFKIVPREYVTTATMLLTDDSTNTTTTYASITPFSPVLEEGRFYNFVLKNSSNDIIYKDKIFCTVQGVDQTQNEEYTINKDVYTSDNSYDNDFIIL